MLRSCAGEEIVDAEDVGALGQQPLAQMRAEKAGAAGDQNALLQMHDYRRFGRTLWAP